MTNMYAENDIVGKSHDAEYAEYAEYVQYVRI
jgi:hypothetical protein